MKTITTEVRSQKSEASGQWPVASSQCCLLSAVYCLLSTVYCLLLLPALSFAAFETLDTGARQSGMGEAYAAIGGDIHSLFHNPAGLAYLNRKEFSSSYSKLFMGLDDKSNISSSQLLYGQPVTARGSFGLGWMETKLDSLYKERTLSVGYGYGWKDNLAIGAALKQLQITEEAPQINYDNSGFVAGRADPVFANGNSAAGIGADLGVLYEPVPGYSLGLSLHNINQPKVSLADSDRVPALIRFGIARRSPSFLLASEIRTREFIRGVRDYQAVLGAEKWWSSRKNSGFAVRGSLANGSRTLRQFTLGLGYRVNDVQVDYSFLIPLSGISFGNSYGTHRISFSARFGHTVPKNVSWALAPYGVEQTPQALQEQIKNLADELEKQRQILASISSAAGGLAPAAPSAAKARPSATAPAPGAQAERLDVILDKLRRVNKADRIGIYMISELCREVLKLEPENPTALVYMGTARYLLGHQAKAFSNWLQARKFARTPALRDELDRAFNATQEMLSAAATAKPQTPAPAQAESAVKPVIDAKSVESLYEQGLKAYAQKNLDEAVRLLKEVIRKNPDHERAKKALDRILKE